jgi:hypothetical protein
MLKINLLAYFLELHNDFSMSFSKTHGSRLKFLNKKNYISEPIQKFPNTKSSPLFEIKKSNFFLGKTFQYHYCDTKIVENKTNLTRHVIKSHILIGSFFQSTGSLVVIENLDRIFYINRKKFFNLEVTRYLIKNTKSWAKIDLKIIPQKDFSVIFLEKFHMFNNFKSRINLGLIAKLCNIKFNTLEYCELFFEKGRGSRFILSQFFRNYGTIKLRRGRIFSLQFIPPFIKRLWDTCNQDFLNFQKGFFQCILSGRFFLNSNFFLTNNLIFPKDKIIIEIHKGLFDWFFQLKTEDFSGISNMLPDSKYFFVNNSNLSQLTLIFNRFPSSCKKKTQPNFCQNLIGFSLLKNDLDWNTSLTVSELSMDFSLQLSQSQITSNLPDKNKYNSLFRIILSYFFSFPKNVYFLNPTQNDNRFVPRFFKKLKFRELFDKSWNNMVFEDINFVKKKLHFYSDLVFKRDIAQKHKLFLFLAMKTYW